MKINPMILPIQLPESQMPDEGIDIVMTDINDKKHYGYFLKSSEYVFMGHNGNILIQIKEWEYE